MSYCVECGVELSRDLERCPLCATPVINPGQPSRKEEPPYPEAPEEGISHMDRGYARQLSVVAALIPMLAVLLVDVLDGGGLWSPFVIGALALMWCFFAVPLLFRPEKPYLFIALDVLALCGYLALIAALTDGFSWYLGVVLPLLVLLGALTLLTLLTLRRVEMKRLHRAALVLLLLCAALLGTEIILDLNASGRLALGWSVYTAIPLLVVALMLAVIEQNSYLKEEIRKRLFV